MKKSVETLSTLTLCFLWLEVLQYLLEVDASRGVLPKFTALKHRVLTLCDLLYDNNNRLHFHKGRTL